MNIRARPYRDGADLVAMRQLLIQGKRANIPASYMHPGCLDWATHCPPDEQKNRRNILVWERIDGNRPALEAWAIFAHREGSFDLFVHPTLHGTAQHERVMDEYLVWAEARAREAGLDTIWPFWAMDYDQVLDRLMKARGFVADPASPAPPLFERSLDVLPDVLLPTGFSVHNVESIDAGRQRADVAYNAFQYRANWDSYWADYAQFMRSAVYDGKRDLLVRYADGRGASASTLWFDPINAVGLFEPVCTHPDFQGRGLAKVVMTEGMRRMQSAGMRRAIVGFDPSNVAALALYSSLGFSASCYFSLAQKKI